MYLYIYRPPKVSKGFLYSAGPVTNRETKSVPTTTTTTITNNTTTQEKILPTSAKKVKATNDISDRPEKRSKIGKYRL